MFKFYIESEVYCRAEGSGSIFAKKGSMIADKGSFKYSKRLLGTNQGSLLGQIGNHIARRVTGENLELMEIKGTGIVYLADMAAHVTVIELEPDNEWQQICLESENILAFTDSCKYGVEFIPAGIATDDLCKSKLTYNGTNAFVAVKTAGNPLLLEAPCRVDPDALIAWTGKKPVIRQNVDVFKTIIGQSNGESYLYEFNQPGQYVLVQSIEKQSKIGISIDRGGSHTYNSYNRH